MIISFFLLAAAGFAGAVQALLMGRVTKKLSIIDNVTLNYLVGFILSLAIYGIFYQFSFKRWHVLDWYEVTLGIYGMIIVGSIGFAVNHLGVFSTLLIAFVAQSFFSGVVDHFGLFGGEIREMTMSKFLAFIFIFLGAFLLLRD